MLRKRNLFNLDHKKIADVNGKVFSLPVSAGLVISKKSLDNYVPIADVEWSTATNTCYFQTYSSNFQDYITSFEEYGDFVYMLDEAYYLIELVNKQTGEQE